MSFAILKFSDLIEETVRYGLAGRSYTMDETDALWLDNWNQVARGEGTSTGSTRRSRAKAGDAAEEPVIDEDWFELCMGLFEKFSSEQLPYLHVVCPNTDLLRVILTSHIGSLVSSVLLFRTNVPPTLLSIAIRILPCTSRSTRSQRPLRHGKGHIPPLARAQKGQRRSLHQPRCQRK